MTPLELSNIQKNDSVKYSKIIEFIQKWWELLTIEELIEETNRVFFTKLSKENLETIKLSYGLINKGKVKDTKRKAIKVEMDEILARAVFLETYSMRTFDERDDKNRINKEEDNASEINP